jgi:hypothetical protein
MSRCKSEGKKTPVKKNSHPNSEKRPSVKEKGIRKNNKAGKISSKSHRMTISNKRYSIESERGSIDSNSNSECSS